MRITAELKSLRYASGVYAIRSLIDDRIYVGSAVSLSERYRLHCYDFRTGRHANAHLLQFYNKHGSSSLEFIVLELCEKADLILREQYFIDRMRPKFNICHMAGNTLGRHHSEATRKQISEKKKGTIRNIGRVATAVARLHMRIAAKGRGLGKRRAPFTEAHRANIAKARIVKQLATGTKNHFAKLNESRVMQIKRDLAEGMRVFQVAKKYGISKSAASHIKVGRRWTSIEYLLGETQIPKQSERETE